LCGNRLKKAIRYSRQGVTPRLLRFEHDKPFSRYFKWKYK